jgi:hypothetical protein
LRTIGFDADGTSDSIYAEILSNGQRLPPPNPGWYRFGGMLPGQLPMDFSLLHNDPIDVTPYGWTGYAAPEHVDGTDADVPAVFTIDSPGTYTIRISEREDGTSLDALILQLSAMDPPAGGGPNESPSEATVSTDPPMISFQAVGNQLNITWTNGGDLQAADTVLGQWNVVGSGGSYSTTMTGAMRFFRVVRP